MNKVETEATAQPKTLEDYENDAFAAIKKMKRPAASASMVAKNHGSSTSAPATQKPKAEVKSKKQKLTCFGCSRCRGNPLGCPSCDFLDFQGKRLNGRKAWKTWWNQQQNRENKPTKVKKCKK